jgi:hypothetical protein
MFVDYGRINSHRISCIINGLFDQEVHYLVFNYVFSHHKQSFRTKIISNEAITEFQNMLNKNWDEVLQQTDVNKGFNIF